MRLVAAHADARAAIDAACFGGGRRQRLQLQEPLSPLIVPRYPGAGAGARAAAADAAYHSAPGSPRLLVARSSAGSGQKQQQRAPAEPRSSSGVSVWQLRQAMVAERGGV